MKEIKFISHIFRNLVIVGLFVITSILFGENFPDLRTLILLTVGYFIAYPLVYFINDFVDSKEDERYGRSNLYNTEILKKYYWPIAISIFILGSIIIFSLSIYGGLVFLSLIVINIFYSVPPFRFRKKVYLREFSIALIYFIKSIFLSVVLYERILVYPLSIAIFIALLSAVGIPIYKRYYDRNKRAEIVIGSVFLVSYFWIEIFVPETRLLALPLAPILVFLAVFYKGKMIPLGFLQFIYFTYAVIIFMLL